MKLILVLTVVATIALAVRMAGNAPSMAPIQKVAEKSAVVVSPQAEDQLGGQDQPTDGNPEAGVGETEVVGPAPADETPAVPAEPAAPVIDHSKCPHPLICEHGDCQRDYAIIFSTAWCGPCKQLHRMADALIAQGYRIYYWDADKAPTMASRYQIDTVPTTLFFNHGELRERYEGLIPESLFRKNLTPRYDLTP